MPVFPALPFRLLSRFRPCLSLTSLPRLLPDQFCTCDSRPAFSWNPRLSLTSPLPTICRVVFYQLTAINKAGYRLSLVSRVLHFGPQLVCDSLST
ncbi:hypothetical protein CesoFtcFv8_003553 [Champsocephalus esox]|uniref:Uncharacterized protein n=1 Tax=Champsocephalus esox TaxID=159716 RepID=A0AAN8CYH9_9TELE|nr:hypothetical protein CesoFtcFv8_003553 [Champsocephalus esox]